jgi:hypothetical protein
VPGSLPGVLIAPKTQQELMESDGKDSLNGSEKKKTTNLQRQAEKSQRRRNKGKEATQATGSLSLN